MKKIVLVNCYFGEFPNYFEVFLNSCKNNETIDFIIFSDSEWGDLPSNVRIINCSFEQLKERIQGKFDFTVNLNTPYKLCDYKPAYGYIFEDFLKEYDFWGYCDIDLIFGDIRSFLTEEVLNNYEKIYRFGHLTLYRNTKDNNRLFMKKGNPYFKESFTTDVITVFDEVEGINIKYLESGLPVYEKRDYADITPKHHRFLLSKAFIDIPNDNKKNQVFVYEKGKVYRYYENDEKMKKEEFIYIHFQKRKMPINGKIESKFFITYDGFVPCNGEVTLKQVRTLNAFRLFPEIAMAIKSKKRVTMRKIRKIRGKS